MLPRRRRASRRRAMVAIYARYEGPAPRQDARPVRRRRWQRTTRARPPPSSGARSRRERTSRRRGARPPPRSATGWTSAASTGARPSSSCPSSSCSTRCAGPWRAGGGWMPRVETTRTLAESLGPCDRRGRRCADALAADRPVDRPQAAARPALGLPSGPDATASASTRPSAGWSPRCTSCSRRWREAAAPAGPRHGPSSNAPCRPAGAGSATSPPSPSEWAALAPPPRTDRAVRPSPLGLDRDRGGRPRRAGRLAARGSHRADPHPRPRSARRRAVRLAGIAALAGASVPAPASRTRRSRPRPRCWRSSLPAAAPVALVAHDRLLVRRVHELLVRSGARVVDETGWRLSTTRAARRLHGPAAQRPARRRQRRAARLAEERHPLGPPRPARHRGARSRVRRAGVSRVAGLATVPLHDAAAERLRDDAVAVLRPLQDLGSAPLAEWLAATLEALRASGGLSLLADDAAGTVLLQALLLDLEPAERVERLAALTDLSLSLAEFTRWCRRGPRAGHLPPGTEPLAGCDGRRRRCRRHAARASDAAAVRRRRAARLRRRASAPGPCPTACCRARPPRWPACPPQERRGASGSPSPRCCASRR